jgi:hypothetical protein
MRYLSTIILSAGLVLSAAACKKDGGDAAGEGAGSAAPKTEAASAPAAGDKPTAAQCQEAYEHVSTLNDQRGEPLGASWLELQKGNIENCPKMSSVAALECMKSLTEYSMKAEMDCMDKK